ncbi:hypothetical protein K525DRAFT_281302 [Schizophyllum commune Loenen D]|nr:hypothetical protein K525DRAFT_281302 [Schizophyllum commune Loenen D]
MSSPLAKRSLLRGILPELIDEDRCTANECLSGELNPQPRNVASEVYSAADVLYMNWEMGSRPLAICRRRRRAKAALSNNCRIVHSAGLELIASWRALAAVLRTVGEASPGGRISDHHIREVKALFSAYDHRFRTHESTREKASRLHDIGLEDRLVAYPV